MKGSSTVRKNLLILLLATGNLSLQGQSLSLAGSIGYYVEPHYGNDYFLEDEVHVRVGHSQFHDYQATVGLNAKVSDKFTIGLPLTYRLTVRSFEFEKEPNSLFITKGGAYGVHMLHVPISLKLKLLEFGSGINLNALAEPGLIFQFSNVGDEFRFTEPDLQLMSKVATEFYHINRKVIPVLSFGVHLEYKSFYCQIKQSLPYRYSDEYSTNTYQEELDYRAKLSEVNFGYAYTFNSKKRNDR
jgi:hypothetical protein